MSLEKKSFEFGNFILDGKEKILLREGKPLSITPKAFQVLQILVENHGHVVEREQILNTVWAGSFVEEGNLTFTIRLLRKALDDNKQNPQFIETVTKRGYRFIAPVTEKLLSNHQEVSIDTGLQEDISMAEIKDTPIPSAQRPYFLILIGIISLISIFSISFFWLGKDELSNPNNKRFTRLTNNKKITNIAALPDGKNFVFSQKEGIGESLWLQRIESNESKQILPPQDVEFVGLSVSPDGEFAYYTTFSKNQADTSLSKIALNNGSPESIPNVQTDVSVSFSPDGKRFAYTESHTSLKETHLMIANADGSNQRILTKTSGVDQAFPTFRASPVAWSPDGETIACVVQETSENSSFYKILLVNAETGSKKYLSEKNWKVIQNIVWKDAENLSFIEFEAFSPARHIWQISQKTGESRQLNSDLSGYEWLSSSTSGELFTLQRSVFSSLHVAEVNENTNELISKQIFGESSNIENVVWRQDGKILYNSRTSGENEIWQINADGTTARQLTNSSRLTSWFAVSPVDNSLVFSNLQNGKIVLSIADSNGQNIRQITDGPIDVSPNFTPDGKTVIFQRGDTTATLWQTAADGTKPAEQLTGYVISNPSVSPNGQTIAYHFIDFGISNPHWKLGLINREDRKLLKKLEFPVSISERKTVWYPKGDWLTMIFNNPENAGMLLLSVTDGKFRTIQNIGSGKINSVSWSADANRLVFSQTFEKSDVVSLTNF